MKRFFTVLLSLFIVSMTLLAQDIDETYVFADSEYNVFENGATIVRNVVNHDMSGAEVIYSGVYVMDMGATVDDYLRMHYTISRIDNGTCQICFPITCNSKTETGTYETSPGHLDGDLQDIQCEWFPEGGGTCIVELQIERLSRYGFPPQYEHEADGPTITLMFVKSSSADDGNPFVKLADGVYLDGTILYICSGVTSLGGLQVNPSEIYCYAATPPACLSNTFTGYDAILHVPAASMVSYFTALYWLNFNNILSDAIEPQSVTMNTTEAEVEIGQQLSLSATVTPGDATPKTVYWSSTDTSVAKVSNGGKVTAVAAGECNIIATCVDKVATCHVNVVSPRVTITLDKHEAQLLPNHTITLTATCSPVDVDLSVTSSNPGVAIPRIVNGTIMVVGVAEGTATITVNAADGWGHPDSCVVTVYTEPGDVNSDGYVNISDVTALINYLLNDNSSGVNLTGADCNNDSSINISDVTTLINFLLSGKWSWEEPQDGHEWVDLGLPSGTLWATCNVGANSPEEYGDYFAWGETSPKDYYDWITYEWCNGSTNTMTKYCTQSDYGYNGFTDGKTELDLEDDAVYVNWGASWRMPTKEQHQELVDNCTWTWTQRNGVDGQLGTGPNGNTIFLPAAGRRWIQSLFGVGLSGYFWSRSLYLNESDFAYNLYSNSDGVYWSRTQSRVCGRSIRAVRVSQN